MMFNLEGDVGAVLSFFLVPDSVAGIARIVARSGGRSVMAMEANQTRQVLVDAGRHQTGLCGFLINEEILPGLSDMTDLELYDADSGLLIYRRPGPELVEKKVFRIETHLFPLWRFDEALKPRFQYFARGIDRHGRETTTQMFQLSQVNSVYLTGRLLFTNYRHYIETRKFETVFVMHHPYEEMAERLLMLGQIKKASADVLGMRENMSLSSTIEFAQSLPFHDEGALRKRLYGMPGDVAQALANPVARQLTARTPDEAPPGRAVSIALEALASFTIVGLRRDPETLRAAVAELVSVDPLELPELEKFRTVAPLALALKRSRVLDVLLEQDLEIYEHIASAFKNTA